MSLEEQQALAESRRAVQDLRIHPDGIKGGKHDATKAIGTIHPDPGNAALLR